jgi:hypothetical protein
MPLALLVALAAGGPAVAQSKNEPVLQRGTATIAPPPMRGTATVAPAPQGGFATVAPAPQQGPASMGPPPGMAQQAAACMQEFVPLREAAEKRAGMITAAAKRKAPRDELCKLFNGFLAAETKLVKYMETNRSGCGIPDQAISNLKKEHARVTTTRQQVCSGAPMGGPSGPPPGPSLSDALGAPRVAPGPTTSSGGLGTWDTLTGNPIRR